jgi:hypothetical protein
MILLVNYEKKKLYYTSAFNAENFMKARICFNFYMKYIGKYFSVNYNCIWIMNIYIIMGIYIWIRMILLFFAVWGRWHCQKRIKQILGPWPCLTFSLRYRQWFNQCIISKIILKSGLSWLFPVVFSVEITVSGSHSGNSFEFSHRLTEG